MRSSRLAHLHAAGAGLFAAAVASASVSSAKPPPPVLVHIDVKVVSASRAKGPTDPRLASLQARLSQFAFTSYRLVSEKSSLIKLHSEEVLPLPGHRSLEIVPRGFERSGRLRVHLHLYSGTHQKLIDADYVVAPGGDLLVGGPKTGNATLLIFIHHGG